ncbi:hypothetical protein M5D96_009903, partial [Drosophila gunungcola]
MGVLPLQHSRFGLAQLRLLREAQVRLQLVEKAPQIGHGSWKENTENGTNNGVIPTSTYKQM